MMAMSSAVHSQRVRDTIDTASPFFTPKPIRPLPRAITRSRNCVAENDFQPPSALYSTVEPSGSRWARRSRKSNRLISSSIGSFSGLVNSLTMVEEFTVILS